MANNTLVDEGTTKPDEMLLKLMLTTNDHNSSMSFMI